MYFDDGYIKTHCFCSAGEVISYKSAKNMLIGGRSYSEKESEFTNVAILYKCIDKNLKKEALSALDKIGDNFCYNTLYQDISSFIGREKENTNINKMKSAIPYDIRKIWTEKITKGLQNFIIELENKGYLSLKDGIVHAPSAEWVTKKINTSFNGETEINNLYIVGDGSGRTQGIIAAATMGVRSAKEILERYNYGK